MIPFRAIQKQGIHEAKAVYIDEWMTDEKMAREVNDWADIIIIQRLLVDRIITKVIKERLVYHKPVVIDLDDGYDFMPLSVRSYTFWKQGEVTTEHGKFKLKNTPLEQLRWGVKLCSALTSPSQIILDDWERFQHNRYLIPNYPFVDQYAKHRGLTDPRWITIGWGGSSSHYESFTESKVIPAIRRVLSSRKNVRFMMAGGHNHLLSQITHPSYQNRVLIVDWVPYEQWPTFLGQLDIGLVPLSGPYDERRSWIKPLEYAIMGIPWVGVANAVTQPFADQGCLVRPNTQEWTDAILNYIDNIDRERGRAIANRVWGEAQDINLNIDKIIDVYQKIIDDNNAAM